MPTMLSRKLKAFARLSKPTARPDTTQPIANDDHGLGSCVFRSDGNQPLQSNEEIRDHDLSFDGLAGDTTLQHPVSAKKRSLYAPDISLAHLAPMPSVLKSFRRLSARSAATSATAVTDSTDSTDVTDNTDTSGVTAVAKDAAVLPNDVRVDTITDGMKVAEDDMVKTHTSSSMPPVQYLTALDLSVLEFSPPVAIPAFHVPSDEEEFFSSWERAFRRPQRYRASLFDVLPMWASHPIDNVDCDAHPIDDVESEPAPRPRRAKFVLPRTPRASDRAPLLPPKGGTARLLRAWRRRRITTRPELEGIFRPFVDDCGPVTDDVFGRVVWVHTSPRARPLSGAHVPAAGHATGYQTPVCAVPCSQPKGAYMLPTPRIYPKDSCFTTGNTCPCLPTLLSQAKTPSTEGKDELTFYLAELANELREIVACSPGSSVRGSEVSCSRAASLDRLYALCRRMQALTSTEDATDLSADNAGGWGPLLPPIALVPSSESGFFSNGGWDTPPYSRASELVISPSLEVSLTSIAEQLRGFSPA